MVLLGKIQLYSSLGEMTTQPAATINTTFDLTARQCCRTKQIQERWQWLEAQVDESWSQSVEIPGDIEVENDEDDDQGDATEQ